MKNEDRSIHIQNEFSYEYRLSSAADVYVALQGRDKADEVENGAYNDQGCVVGAELDSAAWMHS